MWLAWIAGALAAPEDVDALFRGAPGLGVTRCRAAGPPDVAWVRTVRVSGVAVSPPPRVALYVAGERVLEEEEGATLEVRTAEVGRRFDPRTLVERVEADVVLALRGGAPLAGAPQLALRWTCETTRHPPVPSAN